MSCSKFGVGDRVVGIKNLRPSKIEGVLGTVRSVGEGDPPIGVEWDDNVGGHTGGKHFNCKQGHGYYVFPWNLEKLEKEDSSDFASDKVVITFKDSIAFARLYSKNKVTSESVVLCEEEEFTEGAKKAFEGLFNKSEKREDFPWKEWGKGNVFANCKTRKDSKVFLKEAERRCPELEWTSGGPSSINDYWDFYGEGTLYNTIGGLGYCNIGGWFQEQNPLIPIVVFTTPFFNGKVRCVHKNFGFTLGKTYIFVDGQVIDDDGALRPVGRKIEDLSEYFSFISLAE